MKSCMILVCFTFFAVATAFTVYDKILGEGWNDTNIELADNKDCKCVNARCVFNKGKMKCVCYPKHSLTDEQTCQPCDCGKLGQCIFVLSRSDVSSMQYTKKCICNAGSAEKDGKCVDCNCGENSKCEFDGDERTCYCLEGFAEKDGVCRECNCGKYGECEFVSAEKQCTCFDGFLLNNGICEECDCGEFGKCSFQEGKKVCDCVDGYKENDGYCEECKCENSYGCDYVIGRKRCWCNQGYIQRDDTCVVDKCVQKCGEKPDILCYGDPRGDEDVSCECRDADKVFAPELKDCKDNMCVVKCGRNSGVKCYGDPLYEVSCGCDDVNQAFVDKDVGCKECNCGSNSVGCDFSGPDTKYCKCKEGFVDKRGVCEVGCGIYRSCENGGVCEGGFCRCRPGTRGEFCEVIDGCNSLCPEDSECFYDVSMQQADCKCRDSSRGFNRETRSCKITCDTEDRNNCNNGGECKGKFCDCPPGTSGDLCEQVDECEANPNKCKDGSKCVYNIYERRAYCQCPVGGQQYDPRTERCKRTCDGGRDSCKNGGKCGGTFCECPPGTSGDNCQIVDECTANPNKCKDGSECVYNTQEQRAYCRCPNEGTQYDPAIERCKRTCDESNSCRNGGKCSSNRFCECLPGTSGEFCETIDECPRCDDGSYCVFDATQRKAMCACKDENKSYDYRNNKCKATCQSGEGCRNGGECEEGFCKCLDGTSGDLCEDVDACVNGLCGNGNDVRCVFDVNSRNARCECEDSKIFDPVTKCCRVCDCGRYGLGCTFTDGKKVCNCPDGFAEKNGVCEKTRCIDKSCSNGKCVIVDGEEVCKCFEGYALEGDYCRRLNCTNTPCIGGTCVVRHGNIEECVCPAGHSLIKDTCIRGSCRIDTCFGGHCETIQGELMCVCPKGYELKGIGCFATVCEIQNCFGGYCVVNDAHEEVCTCHDGYYLENDVCRKILCQKNSCFGGHCDIKNGEEVCTCPAGHTLYEDVCRVDLSHH